MRSAERHALLTGVGAVALWVLGTFLLEKDDRPEGKNTAELVAWVEANDTAILVGAIVFGFGVLLFLWMLGSLRSRLLAAEGSPVSRSPSSSRRRWQRSPTRRCPAGSGG